MKQFIKNFFEHRGVRINLVKNLWYLDGFSILKSKTETCEPVIFDIGACDGSSVIDFKKKFPKSTVYSFEPFPASFERLQQLARNFAGVKCFQMAMSNTEGVADFFVNKSPATNSLLKSGQTGSFADLHSEARGVINVSCVSIDKFMEQEQIEQIDIMKMDVQGGEMLVLQGAENALRTKKIRLVYSEVWFIEGYVAQPLYYHVANFLGSFGYLPFGIYNMHYRKDGHFLWGDAIFYAG